MLQTFVLYLYLLLSMCYQIIAEGCVDQFCPPGTYCDERIGPCRKPPCRPILVCLPNNINGCSTHSCPSDKICVERVIPCIGRSCKKAATCAKPGTCDSIVCGPSHRCISDPSPHCIKYIPSLSKIIGNAILSPQKSTSRSLFE